MVRAVPVVHDGGRFDTRHELARGEEVVDAPADVSLAGVGELVPVGVGVGLGGVEVAEDVGKAVREELVEPGALDGQEADVRLVRIRTGEVYLFVRDVHVAGDEHGDFLRELVREFEEGVVEIELVLELLGRAAAVREVAVDEHEVFEVEHERAALLVEAGNAEPVFDLLGDLFGIDGHAAIAFFVCRRREVRLVARHVHGLGRKLGRIALGLLEGQDVGILAGEEGKELVVAQRGAQAVGVPGDDLHIRVLYHQPPFDKRRDRSRLKLKLSL